MSKDEYDSHLKFGQGILIEGFKTEGNDTGFLTTQGFADIKAKYQTYDDILYFKNYRNSIFQILPAGNFELNDQLQKALIQNEGQEDTPNIKILKARAESQKYQFELNIENNMKKKICFGQNVIFKHIDSKSYVSGTIKPSTGSNGAFTVQVSDKLSESLVFKLLPYRSFEFLDMAIPFDSPILIRNEFNNGFLTFEKIGISDQGRSKGTYIQKKPIESNDTYRIPVKTQSIKSDIYEVVTHFVDLSVQKEVPMPWRFKLHVNDVINDTLIQHDVVYLKHTQNNGVLSIQGNNIILKQAKENSGDDLKFYQCLWEIEKHNEDAYILRHLMSGMICSQQIGAGGLRRPFLQDISAGKEEGAEIGGIHIKLAKKQGGDIGSESFVNIAWNEQLLQTHEEDALQEIAAKAHDLDARIDLAKMKSIYKKEIQFNIRPLAFKKSITQEHCFVINQIPDDLKEQLLFALSFHSVIIKLREDLQWGAIEAAKKISYLRMMQVTNKIREIKIFIKKCSEEQAQFEHIFPMFKRQMICKDLGISELLFELLYFMKMNLKEDIFSDKHNQKQKFLQLYNTIYQVIIQLIRNNKQFKMHISKWFQFILDDVIHNNQLCQFNLIKELLKDNYFFVNNFVNKEIIEYLTSFFFNKSENKEYQEKKYLQIFRLFCITDNQVNNFNQKLIIDYFHKKLIEVHSQYMIQIERKNDAIVVSASIDKSNYISLSFEEFHEKCSQENPSAWGYFVEYLNLIADLVQGRNKITEEEINKLFSLDLLGDLFEHYKLYQAEVPIIRLVHYLYAESQYYYPIEKKRRILKFNDLLGPENVNIHSTASEIKPWDPPFDRILVKIQQKLNTEYEAINPIKQQYGKNQTLLNLLKFLWQTLNLGFWHEKNRLKQILCNVLKILNKHPDIVYEQVMKASKENILMIACKMQCLHIIDLIAQLDNDIFLQIVANKFKIYEFPEKKFSLKGILSNSNMMQIKCDHEMVHSYLTDLPDQTFIQPIIETNICQQLIEMSNYNNPQLTSKAIGIMDRILQTRRNVFNQFASLILISEEERQKLLEFMQSHRNKFFILEDSNIVHVSQDNQACNYFMVSDPQRLGLMEVLYLLTELMKNQNSVLNIQNIKSIHESGIFEALGSDRLINFTGQRSSTNRMKQEIIYSSNLHIKIINFIFSCHEIPEESLAVKLLHLSYYFIVSLIENFNQIKALMQGFIPKLMHHIKKNVGCIDFLKEMYDNNKTMLYNESVVFQLIQQICQNIQNESQDSYYKSKLLDFFRYLIYCNGRALKNHQIQILKIMQDDSYPNIMIQFDRSDLQALITQYQEQNQGQAQIVMSAKLTYLCTFFQIMTSLIDTDNKVNISKLIKRYPFDTLVDFIVICKTCWTLKRNIRSFINRLYYFQPDIDTELKCILSKQFSSILQDLDMYIEMKLSPENVQFQNKKFRSPVRFSYIESYHYLLIEEILFAVYHLASGKIAYQLIKYFNNFAKTDIESSYNFIKISERIAFLQLYFTEHKNIYSNSLIKFILSKLKILLLSLDDKLIYEKGFQFNRDDESSFKNGKEALINRITEGKVGHFYLQKDQKVKESLPLTYFVPAVVQKQEKAHKTRNDNKLKEILRNIFKREKRDFENEDERICYNLGKLVSSIKLSPEAQKYFLNEYEQKVETYYLREDRYAYISRIIQLNSQDPLALTPERKLFFLQYITGLVQLANKPKAENAEAPAIQPKEAEQFKAEIPEEQGYAFKVQIDQWQAETWNPNEKQIVKTQKELKNCKLGKFIVELLKQDITNNVELANSILLCAIAYLLGGNPITQKDIIEQLQKDSDNQVFGNIEALMVNLGKLIRKNIDESQVKQSLNAEFSPETVDNYDYYDINQKYALRKNVFEPNSTDQFIYNKLCITTYRRAFKFLQLLCQNNNKQGKHFIRVQPDKAKQYNFINITTKQLRNLFEIFCEDIKEVPLFLMDFILQVTQIPIYENQEALTSSTFFEDLCQLKNNFTSNPNLLSERGFSSSSNIEQIYHKSFLIILSNFQGNNPKTFQILDGKLQSKFLIEVMKQKLLSMNITNRDELIKHINDYSNIINDKGSKNTGFDEDILILLNISVIFLKIKDALGEKSRIHTNYEKFKKQMKEEFRLNVENRLVDEHFEAEALEQKINQEMAGYKCMYSYLEKCLLNIEITDDNGKDQFIYFPKYPVFNSLTGNLRDFIMTEVNRNSHRDKIVSLLSYTKGVKQKIEYSYNLKKQKRITQDNMNDSFKIASSISILLCIFIGYFYHIAIEYQTAEYYTQFTIGVIRFGISFLQLVFTVLYVFYWLELKLWYNPEPLATHVDQQQEPEAPSEAEQPVEEIVAQEQGQAAKVTWKNNKLTKFLKYLFGVINEILGKINEQLSSQDQKIYRNIQLWRNVIFLGSSVVGTFYFPPMFFLHLIDILAQNPTLGTILYSAIYNFKSLLLVSIMGVFFTFIFCTVTFSNYMKDVYSAADEIEDMCDGVADCVTQLYVSGAIGQTMEDFQIIRFIYDIIYFTFFEMLFGNIVSGLMLDAFSSLREQADALESDKKNSCYICNISREALEKQGEDFEQHTKSKHFLWNYIFYIYVLEEKDETDYTGLQYYIRLQYYKSNEEKEVSWIPDKGSSEYDVETEAKAISQDLKKKHEENQGNVATLQQSIKEFKLIAQPYLN